MEEYASCAKASNGTAVGTAITIGNLAVGDSYTTIFTAPWQAGQHTNTATANGDYLDSAMK